MRKINENKNMLYSSGQSMGKKSSQKLNLHPFVAYKSILMLLLLGVNNGYCMVLESCLGQFDVHKNTIIRTGESQALGGKYLEGVELDTIDECQRLCCETETCDVYIFEAKNDGFCYLFECGPPENFHCKFTRHANYTSAVLTKPRELNDIVISSTTSKPTTTTTLKPYINNVSQQELELTSLKAKQQAAAVVVYNENQVEALSNMAIAQKSKPTQKPVTSNISQCGRFQFSCHSGECIAIYNACDGIPQCMDGSDEGRECSGAPSSSQSVTPIKDNKDITAKKIYVPNVITEQHTQLPIIPRPIPEPIDNREDHNAWANRQIVAELQQQAGSKLKNFNIINQNGDYSHKVKDIVEEVVTALPPVIQVQSLYPGSPSARDFFMPPGQPVIKNSEIMPSNVGYVAGQEHISLSSNQNMGLDKEGHRLQQNTVAQVVPQLNNINTISGQHLQQPQQNIVISQGSVLEPISNTIQVEQKPKNTIPDNQESYEDYVEKSTEPPKKKQHKHKKLKTKLANKLKDEAYVPEKPLPQPKMKITTPHEPSMPVLHEQYKAIHDTLALEFRDHDGFSERPAGAMISLTLGVLVVTALAILFACRMRTVRRRSRRPGGKSSYAQESDFLVNGMYL